MRESILYPLRSLHSELGSMFQHLPFEIDVLSPQSSQVNIHETEDAFLIAVDLPGVSSKDLSISLDKSVLYISGERKSRFFPNENAKPRIDGKFEHTFRVPNMVDTEAIGATYKDGVIMITLRKSKKAQARQIPISVT